MMAAGLPNDGGGLGGFDALLPLPDDIEAVANDLMIDNFNDFTGPAEFPELSSHVQQLYLMPLHMQPQQQPIAQMPPPPPPPKAGAESSQRRPAQPAAVGTQAFSHQTATSSVSVARRQPSGIPKKLLERVQQTSDAVQLPVHTMASWSDQQKLKWTKTMLGRYLSRNQHHHVAKLGEQLRQSGRISLEQCIHSAEQATQDPSIGKKLTAELDAWRRVCEIQQAELSSIKQEQKPGVHGRGTGDYLWEHVLRLLMEDSPTVTWLKLREGLFCFKDSSGAARSWGHTKNNVNMSFEKMSRSIRQYYREDGGGVIQKAPEQPKLHYRFNMTHPDVAAFLAKNFRAKCEQDDFLRCVVRSVPSGQ